MTVAEAARVTDAFRQELFAHLPALADARVRFAPEPGDSAAAAPHTH
jgi:hypothetical protein